MSKIRLIIFKIKYSKFILQQQPQICNHSYLHFFLLSTHSPQFNGKKVGVNNLLYY